MHALMDLPGHPALAVAVNLVIAMISLKAGLVDKSGVAAGLIAGILIFIGFGPEGYALLVTFFVVGSLASKFKLTTKKKLGVAQKKSGQRGASHVFANVSVAAALAAIAILSESEDRYIYLIGFIGALATAVGDTISTELGQIYGKKTYSLITLKRVRTGTEGAVSLEGTLLGFGASAALAVMAYFFHPEFAFPNSLHLGIKGVVVIALAAMMANFIESLIGGILQQFDRSGPEVLMNFLNTLVGAVLAIVWFS